MSGRKLTGPPWPTTSANFLSLMRMISEIFLLADDYTATGWNKRWERATLPSPERACPLPSIPMWRYTESHPAPSLN